MPKDPRQANPLHCRLPAEVVRRRKPKNGQEEAAGGVVVDRKLVFAYTAEKRMQWLKETLDLLEDELVTPTEVFDIVSSTRFAEGVSSKGGKQMAKMILESKTLFSLKQQRALCEKADIVVRFVQDQGRLLHCPDAATKVENFAPSRQRDETLLPTSVAPMEEETTVTEETPKPRCTTFKITKEETHPRPILQTPELALTPPSSDAGTCMKDMAAVAFFSRTFSANAAAALANIVPSVKGHHAAIAGLPARSRSRSKGGQNKADASPSTTHSSTDNRLAQASSQPAQRGSRSAGMQNSHTAMRSRQSRSNSECKQRKDVASPQVSGRARELRLSRSGSNCAQRRIDARLHDTRSARENQTDSNRVRESRSSSRGVEISADSCSQATRSARDGRLASSHAQRNRSCSSDRHRNRPSVAGRVDHDVASRNASVAQTLTLTRRRHQDSCSSSPRAIQRRSNGAKSGSVGVCTSSRSPSRRRPQHNLQHNHSSRRRRTRSDSRGYDAASQLRRRRPSRL